MRSRDCDSLSVMICRRVPDQSDYNSRPHITPGLNMTQAGEIKNNSVHVFIWLLDKTANKLFCISLSSLCVAVITLLAMDIVGPISD